jgi:hypothetical protein
LGEEIPTSGKNASISGQNIPLSGKHPSDLGQIIPTPEYLLPVFRQVIYTEGQERRVIIRITISRYLQTRLSL